MRTLSKKRQWKHLLDEQTRVLIELGETTLMTRLLKQVVEQSEGVSKKTNRAAHRRAQVRLVRLRQQARRLHSQLLRCC